jgi:NADH pyrophosphatase NudC (nudix superfamily)
MRSIGLPELLVILFVLTVPVAIVTMIFLIVRKASRHPQPSGAFSANAFCTQCGNPLAAGVRFCGRCGAPRR